jgi:hypothetical protein
MRMEMRTLVGVLIQSSMSVPNPKGDGPLVHPQGDTYELNE